MVKINYKPWEEVVIHESIKHSFQNLIAVQSVGVPAGGHTAPLLWAEGVAFRHNGMPPTEDVIKEQLQGRIHWSSVEWAPMPEFKPFIEISQSKVTIPMVNVSANEIFSEVAGWLKERSKET